MKYTDLSKDELLSKVEKLEQELSSYKTKHEGSLKHEKVSDALKESEQRFRLMFENHSAIMLLIEPVSGEIVDANFSAEAFYGYSRNELVSMNIENINISTKDEIRKNRELADAQKVNIFNFKHRLRNNSVRDVQVHSTPIAFLNQELLFSIIYDITKQKLADQKIKKFQFYLEKAQELGKIGTWTLDIQKNILKWTEECYKIFGVKCKIRIKPDTYSG